MPRPFAESGEDIQRLALETIQYEAGCWLSVTIRNKSVDGGDAIDEYWTSDNSAAEVWQRAGFSQLKQ